jgi:hypothetical protein
MLDLASIMKDGGKKYLPETDYVAQVKICKVVRNGIKGQVKMKLEIVDTLPEGGMDDMADSIGDNEKFPGGERLWYTIILPDTGQKDGGAFCTQKLAEDLVAFGILDQDSEGELSPSAKCEEMNIDLGTEPSADWFKDQYVGIQVRKEWHFSQKSIDEDKRSPKEDAISRFIALPEGE